MGSTYRCSNPNCGFDITEVLTVDPGTFRCPVCRGETAPLLSDEPGIEKLTISAATDLTDRTRTISGARDATDRSELHDANKATMSLPDFDTPLQNERMTASLPSDSTMQRRVAETGVGSGPKPGATLIGRFQIQSCLGEGAFGVVYRAYDPQLDRPVALKLAKPGSLDTARKREQFLQEAKSAANLRHPNIVPLYEIGSTGETLFICSALIEGRTLESWMQSQGDRFPLDEAVRITRRLAEALAYAHSVGIVHRDVKPQNVLIDARNEPHLTDFGLAARRTPGDQDTNRERFALGTPAYMAPEQADGASEAASDQYSLGCSLFEMLAGVTPFAGSPQQQIYLHKSAPAPSLRTLRKSVRRDVAAICGKMLEKNPRSRYQDCAALAEDLRRFSVGEPTAARPPGRIERVVKWARRSPFQAATVVAVIGLFAAVFAVVLAQRNAADKDLKIQQNEVKELKREEDVLARFTTLYQFCRAAAEEARSTKDETKAQEKWAEVERDGSAAVRLVENEPNREKYALLGLTKELLDEATRELVGSKERARARAAFPALQIVHGDAVLFGSDYNGLDSEENIRRTREAVARGLKLFGVEVSGDGPPRFETDVFTDAEKKGIADRCCELLLIDAECLSRSKPGENIDDVNARLKESIQRIDRAERLFIPTSPTRAGQELRRQILIALKDSAGAETAQKSAAAIEPRLVADRVVIALELYRKGQFFEAMEPLSTALRDQPDHFGAEYLLAVCRLRKGRFPEAREGLSRCLERQPDLAWPKLLRSYAAIELRLYDEAATDLDAVLKNPPEPTAAYVALVNRGVLNLNRRDFDKAIDDFREATQRKPDFTAAHLNLAQTHLRRGEPVEQDKLLPGGALHSGAFSGFIDANATISRKAALDALNVGVQDCPPNVRLFHERGRVRLTLSDFAGAQADFRTAIELATDTGSNSVIADDLIELGRLLARDNQPAEAVRAYRAALAFRPDRVVAYRLMAQPLLTLRKPNEARDALDQYLKTVPRTPGREPNAEEKKSLAEAYLASGQVYEEIAEENAKAFRVRGAMVSLKDGMRPAIDDYTHSLSYRREPETFCLRGWAYLMLNSTELALGDFEDAVRLDPTSPNVLLGRANCRVRLGLIKEAIADADAGLKFAGDDSRHLYNAARVFAQAVPPMRKNGPLARGFEAQQHAGWERKAIDLLRQARDKSPETIRATFLTEFVAKDSAFDNLRNGTQLPALLKEADRPR